jgi:DNA invertase Pin-like site-specific DNA recombinase
MARIGYARVSSADQDCSIQEAALEAAGCDIVRSEKRSGTTLKGRDELDSVLTFIRKGDTLVVTRIDRLARSLGDLCRMAETLKEKGANLRALEQPVDTTTAAGKAFFGMLGVFAQFENDLRRERQMEGIAKAKARGVYKGRKPTVPVDEIKRLASEGAGPAEIARRLRVGRSSVYRALAKIVL